MKNQTKHMLDINRAFDDFVKDTADLETVYAENTIADYLFQFQKRILAQLETQLNIIRSHRMEESRMLSLGSWPGVVPVVLNRLTGIRVTIVDHPSLLTGRMKQFLSGPRIDAVPFDFADAETEEIPVTGRFQFVECCQCIEHWNFSPITLFKRLFNDILDPKGIFFVSVPNAISLYRRLSVMVGQTPYPRMQSFVHVDHAKPGAEVSPHWLEYTVDELRELISYSGGTCTEIRMRSYPVTGKRSLARKIYYVINNLHPHLSETIEAICAKY